MEIQRLFDMLSAASFAESGEHEKALEFLERPKTVLLAFSGNSFDRAGFRYAANVASRIGAAVEILWVNETADGRARLADVISGWKETRRDFRLSVKNGELRDVVMDYTAKNLQVQFVVMCGTGTTEPAAPAGEKTFEEEWGGLRCPLVVVSPSGTASAA